jgi:glycosyltransferase involved in cell wall biosynthesis
MATFNGARFVREQIASIIEQLAPDDELVIVDDASTDDTRDVIAAIDDPRIRLYVETSNAGYVRAFERALQLATGDILLLSDQDDVWTPDRLARMCAALEKCSVAAGNYSILGTALEPTRRHLLSSRFDHTPRRNEFGILIGYRPYFGCAMGLTRGAVLAVLPIPLYFVESHDLWLALVGNALRSVHHLDTPVVRRRLHESNVTPLGWRSLRSIMQARIMLFRGLLEARRRARPRVG